MTQFPNTAQSATCQCSAVGMPLIASEGPERPGYKPLMRNQTGHVCAQPDRNTAEHNFASGAGRLTGGSSKAQSARKLSKPMITEQQIYAESLREMRLAIDGYKEAMKSGNPFAVEIASGRIHQLEQEIEELERKLTV